MSDYDPAIAAAPPNDASYLDPDTCTIEQINDYDFIGKGWASNRWPFDGTPREPRPAHTPRGLLMQQYAAEHSNIARARVTADRARQDATDQDQVARDRSESASALAVAIRTLDAL